MISFRPSDGENGFAIRSEHLSAVEIVNSSVDITFWNRTIRPSGPMGYWFAENQRDTIGMRLMIPGTAIVSVSGVLIPDFIGASDVVFRRITEPYPELRYDTIAYIPNWVMREAEKQIGACFVQHDYDVMYEYFDKVFRFTPITGREWNELKAGGLN